jgi:hypothetical protein
VRAAPGIIASRMIIQCYKVVSAILYPIICLHFKNNKYPPLKHLIIGGYMKSFLFSTLFFLSFSILGLCQEQHTYGPVKENNFTSQYIFEGNVNGFEHHYVGVNAGSQGVVVYRNFNFWEWTSDNIPTRATLQSVNIKFRAHRFGTENFEFSIHNLNMPYNSQTDYYNMINGSSNIIYQTSLTPINDYVFFNQTFTSGDFFNAVAAAITSGNYFFSLGIRLNPESSPTPWWTISPFNGGSTNDLSLDLTITYTTPDQYYTLINQIQNTQNQGHLIFNNDIEHPVPSGTPVFASWGSNDSVRTDELPFIINFLNGGSTQKTNFWDLFPVDYSLHYNFISLPETPHTLKSTFLQTYTVTLNNTLLEGGSGGNIEFKDPWFYYQDELGNWLQSNVLKSYSTPFVIQNGTSSYGGVFLNQLIVSDKPYYSVNSPYLQPITVNGQTNKFFLQNWSGTNVTFENTGSAQTGVVFTSGSAAVTANLKGQLLSNEGSGFSSNGQRKIVRDNSGFYHSVYNSQNLVWYTKSTTTDFTGEWIQDENLFFSISGKNPSIDVNGNIISIVAELTEQDLGISYIVPYDNGTYYQDEVMSIDHSYYGSSYPIIARTNKELFIIYKPSTTSKLKYKRRYLTEQGQWSWLPEEDLPNSTINSKYPSIVGDKNSDELYIVWQEDNTKIKYMHSTRIHNNRIYDPVETISTGSGYSYNTNPSISLTPSGPFVSWTGGRKETGDPHKILGKEDFIFVYRAIMRAKSVSWGDFYVMGENVNYTNNNSTTNSNGETVVAYSRDNGQLVPWARRVGGYYTGFGSISHNGLQVNLSNGSSLSNLKAMVFNTAALPYPINRSTTDFTTIIPKVTEGEEVSYGRTGIISKQDVEFVFTVEDILLDDNNIEFTSRVDTLPVLSLEELNSAARSNTFNLDENSSLLFSLYYLVINPELASTVLGENDYVRFKLELVKTVGDQVVGIFDDITFTKENAYDHENTSYKVDCTGIESGSYYFRITADENCQTGLSIANTQNDAGNLAKKNYTEVYFNGETSPLTYDLSQNYPNPFNPSTTIKYQIPNAGNVTLNVYDILGREVTTLVDEFKNEGRYEVNFNASKLASGVYIYKIQSNDFIASKKLMLLK